MRKIVLSALIFITILLGIFAFANRNKLILWFYTVGRPCGMIFVDEPALWNYSQKAGVMKACNIYIKTGLGTKFSSPLFLLLEKGSGGAYTTETTITFSMLSINDSEIFYSVATHEIAHVIDIRSRGLSKEAGWLNVTGWKCSDSNNMNFCSHPCKQEYPDKAFFCSYKDYETLPSRFGNSDYDPEQTDVSVNPSEDFAESSRYFLNANDALELTSPSRCGYFKSLYKGLSGDPCFDCDYKTKCKQTASL